MTYTEVLCVRCGKPILKDDERVQNCDDKFVHGYCAKPEDHASDYKYER